MARGKRVPPGESLYPECYRPGTTGQRRHWTEGTVTCARCREQARIKLARYRRKARVLGRRTVPALGTQRRIRALGRWGYTRADIGARLGVTSSALWRLLEQDVCFADTAAGVARVYRDLVAAGVPGRSEKTRARAVAKGWPGPGDWDDIDNPDEVPACEIEACHAEALKIDAAQRKLAAKRARRAAMTEEERRVARVRRRQARQVAA